MQTQNNDARLTGAAKPVIFSDGTTLWIEQLSDRDLIELDDWVREKYLYNARKGIPGDATEDDRNRIERIAQETSISLNWYTGFGARMMASIEGMAYITYVAAKHRHPDITVEKITSLLMIERNYKEASDAFYKQNVSGSDSDSDTGTANPTHRGSKKKVKKKPIRRRR